MTFHAAFFMPRRFTSWHFTPHFYATTFYVMTFHITIFYVTKFQFVTLIVTLFHNVTYHNLLSLRFITRLSRSWHLRNDFLCHDISYFNFTRYFTFLCLDFFRHDLLYRYISCHDFSCHETSCNMWFHAALQATILIEFIPIYSMSRLCFSSHSTSRLLSIMTFYVTIFSRLCITRHFTTLRVMSFHKKALITSVCWDIWCHDNDVMTSHATTFNGSGASCHDRLCHDNTTFLILINMLYFYVMTFHVTNLHVISLHGPSFYVMTCQFEKFPIRREWKQGCILSRLLFTIVTTEKRNKGNW